MAPPVIPPSRLAALVLVALLVGACGEVRPTAGGSVAPVTSSAPSSPVAPSSSVASSASVAPPASSASPGASAPPVSPGASDRPDLAAVAVRVEPLADGLDQPVFVTGAGDGSGRLFVAEQPGRIRVVLDGALSPTPFLDITDRVTSGGERGLLGVAFPPGFGPARPVVYVHYSGAEGATVVSELRLDAHDSSVLDPGSERVVLTEPQPYANHNGGWIGFDPDGMLLIALGAGGSGGDPENRAQNLSSRLGKLLQINVDSRRLSVSITGYGLRNPWRFSFDKSGNLYIADVGQNAWEEIDYTPRSSPGIENYGWDVYEGTHPFESKSANSAGHLVMPVAEYSHSNGCSVTGGYVWKGRYYYGDFCSGRVWSLRIANGEATGEREEAINVPSLSSWGLDGRGNLYAVSLSGTVFRVTG
jgi:glucose/arabinose dehydrogenase